MKIRLRDGLSEQQTASILAHELGHVIDDAAGGNVRLGSRTIKMDRLGIRRELRDLSSRLRPDIWMNPKRKAYRESWPELMADGISFYMRYPAEAKRRAPKFAKFLRLIVNEDERLSKTIQFNELAAVLGAGTGVAGAAALSGGLLSEPKPRPMAKSGLLDYRGGL